MGQDKTVVALAGAGDRGHAILRALSGMPGIEVRYVFDGDPDAPGIALARERGILCRTDGRCNELAGDPEIDLVVVTADDPDLRAAAAASTPTGARLVDGAGARLVAGLAAELDAVEERATVEKARYLRQASHQVKSPLSSIQTYVNVILGGYTGEIPERTRDVVQKIHARCDAALAALAKRRLLADLRCLDRDGLEGGQVDVVAAAGEAVARHAEAAAAHGVELRVSPHEGPALVSCVAAHLQALLSELVENAVVYSEDGGLVEVAVEARPDGRVAVVVGDHGIGIPERCLPKIFDEDYRADVAAKHHPDGAGLGLAIVREVATLHGIELDVRSEEGRGTVVTVAVPGAPSI